MCITHVYNPRTRKEYNKRRRARACGCGIRVFLPTIAIAAVVSSRPSTEVVDRHDRLARINVAPLAKREFSVCELVANFCVEVVKVHTRSGQQQILCRCCRATITVLLCKV